MFGGRGSGLFGYCWMDGGARSGEEDTGEEKDEEDDPEEEGVGCGNEANSGPGDLCKLDVGGGEGIYFSHCCYFRMRLVESK